MSVLGRIADAVLGARVPPPPGLPEGLVPAGVTFRRGRLVPAVGGVLSRLGGPAAAVALGRTIVVHPAVRPGPALVAHELVHVRQWGEDPLFPLRYAAETVRRGYRDNRYEVEAREAERAFAAPPAQPREQP